jgi:hypothetical protein
MLQLVRIVRVGSLLLLQALDLSDDVHFEAFEDLLNAFGLALHVEEHVRFVTSFLHTALLRGHGLRTGVLRKRLNGTGAVRPRGYLGAVLVLHQNRVKVVL